MPAFGGPIQSSPLIIRSEHAPAVPMATPLAGTASIAGAKERTSKWSLGLFLPQALLFVSLVVALQWHSGAFTSGFGGHPDEAAHYVTGLMVRQYLRTWPPTSPLKFAESYYLHYPKVAFGHWPPFFYVVQAIWTLIFPPSRASLLLLSALVTVLLALTIYQTTVAEVGRFAATTSALLFILLPIIQRHSEMVMSDTLLALLMLWATLFFSRFLGSERWQDALWFGILAALAILTKGDGLALALVPPFALCITRRWRLLLTLRFWLPLVIVSVFCAPWYWLTRRMISSGWDKKWLAPLLMFRMHYFSRALVGLLGIVVFTLVVTGFIAKLIGPIRSGNVQPKWAALGAMVIGVWVVGWLVTSSWEERYLIAALPACLCFAGAGIAWVAGRLPLARVRDGKKIAAVSIAVAIGFAVTKMAFPSKVFSGFGDAASAIVLRPEFHEAVVLISSDADGKGEGLFISELALREPRPGPVVLRASKVLSESTFMGSDYRLLFNTPAAVMRYLDSVPVQVVVFDKAATPEPEDHKLLAQTIQAYPQRWQLVARYAITRNGPEQPGALEIYRLVNPAGTDEDPRQVETHKALQKHVQLSR